MKQRCASGQRRKRLTKHAEIYTLGWAEDSTSTGRLHINSLQPSHSALLDPLTAALFDLPIAAAALRGRAAAPIGSNISALLNLRCVHNHVISERCPGCVRDLALCSKLLLRSANSSGSAQLNISVQLGLRYAQSHVMAARRLAPVS